MKYLLIALLLLIPAGVDPVSSIAAESIPSPSPSPNSPDGVVILAPARATVSAVRIDPPEPMPVATDEPMPAMPLVWPGLKGRPYAPAGLDACAEMNFYRVQWGLPDRFDDSGRHQRWVHSDGIGWRESKCGNALTSYTGCCFGYWQLYMGLFLKDYRLGPLMRGNCDIWDKRDVLGEAPLAKQKQACGAYQLYSVNGLTPWN